MAGHTVCYPSSMSSTMVTRLIQMSGICSSSLTSPYSSVRTRFLTVGGESAVGRSKPTEQVSTADGAGRGERVEEAKRRDELGYFDTRGSVSVNRCEHAKDGCGVSLLSLRHRSPLLSLRDVHVLVLLLP